MSKIFLSEFQQAVLERLDTANTLLSAILATVAQDPDSAQMALQVVASLANSYGDE